MSVALFDEPIKAWTGGRQVLWLGVTGPTMHSLTDGTSALDDGGFSLVNHTDGTTEWVATKDIQSDWRFNPKARRWFDAEDPAPDDEGDSDSGLEPD